MKLTKAVEILELNLKEAGKKMPPDCKAAVQMGIRALEREEKRRCFTIPDKVDLLPGETP